MGMANESKPALISVGLIPSSSAARCFIIGPCLRIKHTQYAIGVLSMVPAWGLELQNSMVLFEVCFF